MIINQSTETIESGGLTKSNQFSMKNGPHAFKVLSDSLYTDKPYAIMRELICNARDSQLEAKSDKKTVVTFPTALFSTLSIRDYGTGLSEDDVMNLYTTYFDSTKGNSNEMIGAFGLGSKSPFSYTDEFSVTSWFDGEQKDYLVYIGEDGTPTLSLTNTQKSDEPTGLKVAIQIDKEDFGRFERAMLKLVFLGDYVEFRNFGLETTFTELVDKLEGSGTLRLPIDYTLVRHSLFSIYSVEMGGVVYPLPEQYIESLREMGLCSNSRDFIFHFPIGSVDVAPSREHLSVNKRTQKALDKFVEDIAESILKVFSEGIRDNTHLENQEWLSTYMALKSFISDNFYSLPEDVQTKLEKGSLRTNESFCPSELQLSVSRNIWSRGLTRTLSGMFCDLFIPADKRLVDLNIPSVDAGRHRSIPSCPRQTFDCKKKTMFMFSQYKSPQAIGGRVSEFHNTQHDLLKEVDWDRVIFRMSFEEFKRQHKWLYKMLKNVARKGHILLVDLDKYQPPKKLRSKGKVYFHKVHTEYYPTSESYSFLGRRVLSEDVLNTDKVYPVVFTPVTKFDGDDKRCSKIHEYQKLLDELIDLGNSYSVLTGTASPLFPLAQSVYLVSPTHKDNELFEDFEGTFVTLDEALKEAKKRLKTVKKQLDEALEETTKELTSDEEQCNTMSFLFNKKVDVSNFSLRGDHSLVRQLFKLPSELVHKTFFTYESRVGLSAFASTDKAKEFFFKYLRENTKYRGPDDYGVYGEFLACLNEIDSDTERLSNRLNTSQENILKSLKKDIDKAVEEVYKQNN